MTERTRNIAASVRDRLLQRRGGRDADFNLVLQRYVRERFLYRLGCSPHRESFVLKGATLFALWGGALYRPTRDLDFTAFVADDAVVLDTIMREILSIDVPADGVEFLLETIRIDTIRDDSEYHGFRIRAEARLSEAQIRLQVDVGFGDAIVPHAVDAIFPTMLDELPAPSIRACPRETSVAEKLHALITLGAKNTRYKDFYDLCVLSSNFEFDGRTVADAVRATFDRRRTQLLDEQPTALTPAFYESPAREAAWRAFLRAGLDGAPHDFPAAGRTISLFAGPLFEAVRGGEKFATTWQRGGPWK